MGVAGPPDPEQAPAVRRALDGLGFDARSIQALFGTTDLLRLALVGRPLLAYRARGNSALACLGRLFFLEQPEPLHDAVRLIGETPLETLRNAGLLAIDGTFVMPSIRLYLEGELRLVGDLHGSHRPELADFVLGPGPVARMLADLALPGSFANILDLGSGCGVLGCLLAGRSHNVVCSDVSPRAAAFSRFNAALNGIENLRAVEGDLFGAVAGERFDLVLCNPPMVMAPTAEYLYRDGGSEICARIVREVPEHLAPGGCLQMLCNWPERAGCDWRETPRAWFDSTDCDAWLLRFHSLTAEGYADLWLRQQPDGTSRSAEAIGRWVDHLTAIGADRVGGGLVILRPRAHSQPLRTLRSAPHVSAPAGAALQRLMRAQDCLMATNDDAQLLESRLQRAPELEQQITLNIGQAGWQQQKRELRLAGTLGFSAMADATTLGVIAHLDGQRTLAEAAAVYAQQIEVDPHRPVAGLAPAVRELLRLGMLTPV